MSELASEVINIETPKVSDIKSPKKAVKKTLGILELSAGGVLEKNVIAPLLAKLPMPAGELNDLVELIILGLANESINHNDVNNLLGGAAVASAIRLGDKLIERIKGLVKKPISISGTPVVQTADGYLENDFF